MKSKHSDYCHYCGKDFTYPTEGYEADFKQPDDNRGCPECGYLVAKDNHYPWRFCDECHKKIREVINKNWRNHR